MECLAWSLQIGLFDPCFDGPWRLRVRFLSLLLHVARVRRVEGRRRSRRGVERRWKRRKRCTDGLARTRRSREELGEEIPPGGRSNGQLPRGWWGCWAQHKGPGVAPHPPPPTKGPGGSSEDPVKKWKGQQENRDHHCTMPRACPRDPASLGKLLVQ